MAFVAPIASNHDIATIGIDSGSEVVAVVLGTSHARRSGLDFACRRSSAAAVSERTVAIIPVQEETDNDQERNESK